MKTGQFTNEQIVAILQEADKGEKPDLGPLKGQGHFEATFYTWRKRFGGLQTRDVQRLRELEKENARLKRQLAERDLELDESKRHSQKTGERSPETWLSSPWCASVACPSAVPAAWWDNRVPWQDTGRVPPELMKPP
jgi:putative transposase